MNVSVRSYLMAGAVAATATAVAITPVQVMPADVAVPAQPTAVQPQLSQSMVDLLAAAGRMTAALPAAPSRPGGARPAFGTAPAAAVTTGPTANALAFPGVESAIINTYDFAEKWVQYGVDLATYAVGWIPGVGLLAPQIQLLYDFGEAIVASIVYNVADWIGGGVNFAQGVSNVVNASITAGVALANAEVDWVLSFLPPLPPLPFAAVESTTFQSMPPIGSVTGALTNAHEDFVKAVKDLTEGVLADPAKSVLDGAGPEAVGAEPAALAPDAVTQPDEVVTIVTQDEQLDPVTVDTTFDRQDAVSSVPTSVRQSLKPAEGRAPRTLARDVGDSTRKVAATVRADMKKAADNVRDNLRKAVKDVHRGLTGSAAKKPSENSTDGKADTPKPAKTDKKDKAEKKTAKDDKD